jgi:8-oxo-dGTP diphosphatase
MSQPIQKITVKGCVIEDGKIFMLQDRNGMWELPGGRINFGEHPQAALQREFKEELGVGDVAVGKLVDIWDFVVFAEGDEYQFIVVVYICQAKLTDAQISDEHVKADWLPINQLSDYDMREGYRKVIQKCVIG